VKLADRGVRFRLPLYLHLVVAAFGSNEALAHHAVAVVVQCLDFHLDGGREREMSLAAGSRLSLSGTTTREVSFICQSAAFSSSAHAGDEAINMRESPPRQTKPRALFFFFFFYYYYFLSCTLLIHLPFLLSGADGTRV
jgi:hypothetical protein